MSQPGNEFAPPGARCPKVSSDQACSRCSEGCGIEKSCACCPTLNNNFAPSCKLLLKGGHASTLAGAMAGAVPGNMVLLSSPPQPIETAAGARQQRSRPRGVAANNHNDPREQPRGPRKRLWARGPLKLEEQAALLLPLVATCCHLPWQPWGRRCVPQHSSLGRGRQRSEAAE